MLTDEYNIQLRSKSDLIILILFPNPIIVKLLRIGGIHISMIAFSDVSEEEKELPKSNRHQGNVIEFFILN